jgi:hypothetical protein
MRYRYGVTLMLVVASSPVTAETWRCDATNPIQKVYLQIGDGAFDVARPPSFEWEHFCGATDSELARRCGRRKTSFVASSTGVGGGDSYEFDPKTQGLVLRSSGNGVSRYQKLRCVEADIAEVAAVQAPR